MVKTPIPIEQRKRRLVAVLELVAVPVEELECYAARVAVHGADSCGVIARVLSIDPGDMVIVLVGR